MTSDHLTLLALAAMALAGAGYALARYDRRALWLVVAALALNWFGDSLDGTLARVRRVERPRYGFYVDHVLDIVGITLLMVGPGLLGIHEPDRRARAARRRTCSCPARCSSRRPFDTSSGCPSPGSGRRSCASCSPSAPSRSLAIRMSRPARSDACRCSTSEAMVATAGLVVALALSVARNTRALALAEPRVQGRGMKPAPSCAYET